MSQGSTILPTTGVFSGLTEQGNINAALAALLSLNSGGAAPSSPTALQLWADTSVSGLVTLRQYTGSTWQAIWTLDLSTNELSFAASGPQNWVAASGTHDAITATYDPPPPATFVDGMVLSFRATSANLTTVPTFNPNGLSSNVITKNGGQALAPGDIPGAGAEIALRWNEGGSRWELLHPPSVPVGGIVPYFGGTLPSGYVLPQGQNLSATTYPAANAVLGTTYGNPGGGNFTMPDLRGRFFFNLDAGSSNRLNLLSSTMLGATGGSQSQTIAQANLPNVNFNVSGITLNNGTVTAQANQSAVGAGGSANALVVGTAESVNQSLSDVNFAGFSNVTVTSQGVAASGGSGTGLTTIPPAMGLNCMMRIA
jgi:microcystin-dependent protein